jgi:5-formyltetrahydrofolate cyclo-ligase
MTIAEQKRRLRRDVRRRILSLDPIERARQEADLVARFDELPGAATANTVLLFASAFPEEIGTLPLLVRALERGQRLICPRVDRAKRRLRLFHIQDLERDFESGTLNIPEPRSGCAELEPEAIDWALVPGLAYDRRGYRLGRGAGHYDQLIPQLRSETPTWSLALEVQVLNELPVEPHDQPIIGILCPSETIVRRGAGC